MLSSSQVQQAQHDRRPRATIASPSMAMQVDTPVGSGKHDTIMQEAGGAGGAGDAGNTRRGVSASATADTPSRGNAAVAETAETASETATITEDQTASESESESDDGEEDVESSEEEMGSDDDDELDMWIPWFCSLNGHELLMEVDEAFIEDDFNLTGLQDMPYYHEALDAILDVEISGYDEDEVQKISATAEELYLLIHQRFALSRGGQNMMYERYTSHQYGTCPRVLCDNHPLVPMGLSDQRGHSSIKLYCVRCLDVYEPPNREHRLLDGCAYGKTAAHLMFQTFGELRGCVGRREERRRVWSGKTDDKDEAARTSAAMDGSPMAMSPAPGSNATTTTNAPATTTPSPLASAIHPLDAFYVPTVFGFRVHESAVNGARMRWLRRPRDDTPDTYVPPELGGKGSSGGGRNGEVDRPLPSVESSQSLVATSTSVE